MEEASGAGLRTACRPAWQSIAISFCVAVHRHFFLRGSPSSFLLKIHLHFFLLCFSSPPLSNGLMHIACAYVPCCNKQPELPPGTIDGRNNVQRATSEYIKPLWINAPCPSMAAGSLTFTLGQTMEKENMLILPHRELEEPTTACLESQQPCVSQVQ